MQMRRKTFSVKFDAAIPAPFAAFYVDSSAGYLRYVMPHLQVATQVFPSFTGSTWPFPRTTGSKHLICLGIRPQRKGPISKKDYI